jgi:hypothetical protein
LESNNHCERLKRREGGIGSPGITAFSRFQRF